MVRLNESVAFNIIMLSLCILAAILNTFLIVQMGQWGQVVWLFASVFAGSWFLYMLRTIRAARKS